ncbi:MAG: hypothetical protein QOE36_2566 [Gaiellaceae bacterium]|nr:hypothetical protein [Gaiellaceae bacterium]
MDVRLLGSGGWVRSPSRETCCLYAREGDELLLIDAGTGLSRLVTEPALVEGVRRLTVVLTHFHVDHTMGLAWLFELERIERRELYGPGGVVGARSIDLLHRMLDPPLLLREAGAVEKLFAEVHDVGGDERLELGSFVVETRVQKGHTTPTLAYRINGQLVYCTDTAYDEGNAEFARGARVLLHEAFYAAEESEDEIHSGAGEAARIAAAANVDRLVLIHLPPWVDEDELLRIARGHFPAAELGRDGPLALD